MKYRMLAPFPVVLCLASLTGCSVDVEQPTAQTSEAVVGCPDPSPNDEQSRAAATIAFGLMKLAATAAQSNGNTLSATSILAPQRYRFKVGTAFNQWACVSGGIEFDPSDPLYRYVTDAMKAELAFGQLDASEGIYLAGGLKRGYDLTDGRLYPSIFAIPALAQFQMGHSTTSHLRDATSQNDSHYATLTGQAWCGTVAITVSENVDKSWKYAPLAFNDISDWRSVPSQFYGKGQYAHEPTTPFNGKDGQNPYLLVAIQGTPQHWAYESFPPANCWNNVNYHCSSTLEIDPIPYAEPGNYYDPNARLVGTQANPFAINSTAIYADPSHADQWATRTVNSLQEWGTFSTPVALFGTVKYKYAKRY